MGDTNRHTLHKDSSHSGRLKLKPSAASIRQQATKYQIIGSDETGVWVDEKN
ncbi:hypothetical protein H8E77_09640 [bacterium]|nr:hypothetical protein [bacterium]